MKQTNAKPADLFKIWDNYEMVLVAVHTAVCKAYFIPVDKEKFRQLIERSGDTYYFELEGRDNKLYIDGIGIEKKKPR